MHRFSTDEIPERDRLAFLHDFVGRHVAGRRYTLTDPDDFRIEMAMFDLPRRALVATASYPPLTGVRAGTILADGREDYLLTILSEAHEISIAGGATIKVPAGDMMIINDAVATVIQLPRNVLRAVSLSRSELIRVAPRIDLDAFYHIPKSAVGLPLMAGYADLLRENPPQGDRASQTAASHLHDLVGLILDDFVKGGAARNERGIRAARLELVMKDVLARLQDPGLGIEAVARSQGITPRYIQRLFETEGLTFSEFLRDSRLDLALRMLREAAPEGRTIAAIAFDAGFSDLSSFNRSFRRRFGVTPSEIRADVMRERAR